MTKYFYKDKKVSEILDKLQYSRFYSAVNRWGSSVERAVEEIQNGTYELGKCGKTARRIPGRYYGIPDFCRSVGITTATFYSHMRKTGDNEAETAYFYERKKGV